MFIKKTILRAVGASLAAVLSLAAQPLRAQGSDAERLQKLEQAVNQLQKRNAELEQEVSGLKKRTSWEPVVGADGKTKTEVSYDGKTYVEKAVVEEKKLPVYVIQGGPELKLTLSGRIQTQFEADGARAYEGRFGERAIEDRFLLRRARIALAGDFAEHFDFKMEGDFGQGDGINSNRTAFSGTDIFINWHQFPAAQIKVGQWKAPFGLEELTSSRFNYLIERSAAGNAITPGRQVGIQLWGKPLEALWPKQKDLLTYYAGIFNGNGRNVSVNDNDQFMYVGRVELEPWKGKMWYRDSKVYEAKHSFLKLGANILNSRDNTGTNISPNGNLLVLEDGSLNSFNLPSPGERTAWSVDGWLHLGPFDLWGEYFQERVYPQGGGVPAEFSLFKPEGFFIIAGAFVLPKLQLVVRWDDVHPGQVPNSGIQAITAGLNYYIHGDSLKLMVNYVHTWSDFREANPQFGDDQFDGVLARMQVLF